MPLPNFIIIGAAKCGTTSLAHYLAQHPDAYITRPKEPRFFAFPEGSLPSFCGPGDGAGYADSVTNLTTYEQLFEGAQRKKARGEASVAYLYEKDAAGRIHTLVPQAKLIVVLRNPAERAFSNYLHLRRDGRESEPDFRRALDLEEQRTINNYGFIWRYKALGEYGNQLKKYFNLFPAHQIRIYKYRDLGNNLQDVMRDVYRFLGIASMALPVDLPRLNVSGIPRSRRLYQWMHGKSPLRRAGGLLFPGKWRQFLRNCLLTRPKLSAADAAYLHDYYAEDQENLQHCLHAYSESFFTTNCGRGAVD
jgi:hypothetical protein